MLGRGVDELECDELEAARFEAGDDGADEGALDAIGLMIDRHVGGPRLAAYFVFGRCAMGPIVP